MSDVSQNFAFEFSSSERRKGEKLFGDRAVVLGSADDTFVTASVRSSSPGRVTLSCEEVGAAMIVAKCTCPIYGKGDLCRHIWAAVLALEGRGADFLEGKTDIVTESREAMANDGLANESPATEVHKDLVNVEFASNDKLHCRSGSENEDDLNIGDQAETEPQSAVQLSDRTSQRQAELQKRQIAYKEKQKALAKEYRKQQSAKFKALRKQRSAEKKEVRKRTLGDRKELQRRIVAGDDLLVEALALGNADPTQKPAEKKLRTPAFAYPKLIEKARQYFQSNGYEMKQPLELNELIEAKKHLSRVFHPDKGGSHEEILELNRNFQIISDYLKS